MTRSTLAITLTIAVAAAAGCASDPKQRLNAPPHGEPTKTSDLQGTFVYMNDNALLANMTVCDMHFHAHRASLNGAGVERLSRLASLIETYGGSIRFDTRCEDESLNKKRLETIREFLTEAGIDTSADVVKADIAGGEGMDATEAVMIRAKEGTYNGDKKGATAQPAPAGASGGTPAPK